MPAYVKSIAVDTAAAAGDTFLWDASAVSSTARFRLLGWVLMGLGDTVVTLLADSTELSYLRLKDGGGAVCPASEEWHLDGDTAEDLVLNAADAVRVVGHVTIKVWE